MGSCSLSSVPKLVPMVACFSLKGRKNPGHKVLFIKQNSFTASKSCSIIILKSLELPLEFTKLFMLLQSFSHTFYEVGC